MAEFGTVVTVSESDVVNRGEHLAVDFYTPRGWRRVVQLVREHRLVADEVVVIMDYFFLLDSYWRERYNLDWLTYKVPALLAAGATRVILPRTNAMLIMESQATLFGVPVAEWDNPLWVATEKSGVLGERGENATHINRLLESAPFMEYSGSQLSGGDPEECVLETYHKVLAGRYFSRKRKKRGGPCYQIWWQNGSVTWEPKWCLNTLAKRFLDEMHSKQGKRVKFTGSVGVDNGNCVDSVPPHLQPVNRLPWGPVSPVIIVHQNRGSHCALNSVANGIRVPAILYDGLFAVDLPLEQVITSLRDKVGLLTKVCIRNSKLLVWLLVQKEGVYAVESDCHCFTWDCDRSLVLDTDPRFPNPLPATAASLSCMGFTALLKAYRLTPRPPSTPPPLSSQPTPPPVKKKRTGKRCRKKRKTMILPDGEKAEPILPAVLSV